MGKCTYELWKARYPLYTKKTLRTLDIIYPPKQDYCYVYEDHPAIPLLLENSEMFGDHSNCKVTLDEERGPRIHYYKCSVWAINEICNFLIHEFMTWQEPPATDFGAFEEKCKKICYSQVCALAIALFAFCIPYHLYKKLPRLSSKSI